MFGGGADSTKCKLEANSTKSKVAALQRPVSELQEIRKNMFLVNQTLRTCIWKVTTLNFKESASVAELKKWHKVKFTSKVDSSDGLVYDFSLVGGEGTCTIQHEEIVNMHLGTIPLNLGACQ